MDTEKETAADIRKLDVSTLPNSSFNIVLAKRRGGKSTIVSHIIKKLYAKKKLDCAILFSGTGVGFPEIKKSCRFSEIDKLHEIVDRYKAMAEYNQISEPASRFKLRTVVVLDDLLLSLKSKDFKVIESLAVNGRHAAPAPLSLTFFVLAQSLTSIPRLVRNNTDNIIMNNISSMKERDIVMDENLYLLCSCMQDKRDARKLYTDLMQMRDYSFLVIENYKMNAKRYSDYLKWIIADV